MALYLVRLTPIIVTVRNKNNVVGFCGSNLLVQVCRYLLILKSIFDIFYGTSRGAVESKNALYRPTAVIVVSVSR